LLIVSFCWGLKYFCTVAVLIIDSINNAKTKTSLTHVISVQTKNKKTEKETKEGGMEFRPRKGVLKREKFPNTRKPSHCRICAELWKHRGQHNREEK